MKISLIYFDFPFWRAEISRVALFFGNIPFENRIVTPDEFRKVKREGLLYDGTQIPFHQLPCLLIDGESLAQTGAIARFCGKLSGLYPKDPLLAAKADQFIDFATDITEIVATTGQDAGEKVRIQRRKELAEGILKDKLSILEKNIDFREKWICGSQIGLPDIAVWRLMGWLTGGALDGLPLDLLNPYERVKAICTQVDSNSKIQEWVKSTYPKGYNRGNFS